MLKMVDQSGLEPIIVKMGQMAHYKKDTSSILIKSFFIHPWVPVILLENSSIKASIESNLLLILDFFHKV